MANGQVRRHRRRRPGGGVAAPGAGGPLEQPAPSRAPAFLGWQWLTFPVYFAFVAGAFLILLIAPKTNTTLYTVLFLLFFGGVAFGLLHMGVRWWLLRRKAG